jgi:hypothetical protein
LPVCIQDSVLSSRISLLSTFWISASAESRLCRRPEISLKFGEKHVTILITSGSARFATALALNVWLARSTRSVVAAAKACGAHFLATLHETRRRQAALTIARYRHLIADSDIGRASRIEDEKPAMTFRRSA